MRFGARGDPPDELSDDNVGVKRTRSNDRSHIVHPAALRARRTVVASLAAGITYGASNDASACSLASFGASPSLSLFLCVSLSLSVRFLILGPLRIRDARPVPPMRHATFSISVEK